MSDTLVVCGLLLPNVSGWNTSQYSTSLSLLVVGVHNRVPVTSYVLLLSSYTELTVTSLPNTELPILIVIDCSGKAPRDVQVQDFCTPVVILVGPVRVGLVGVAKSTNWHFSLYENLFWINIYSHMYYYHKFIHCEYYYFFFLLINFLSNYI